jgi:hypothetical protein
MGAKFTENQVRVEKIEGLKPDVDQMTDEALTSFATHIAAVVAEVLPCGREVQPTHEVLMNISGGFKGLIPHATMLASIYGFIQLRYLFAKSKAIDHIASLPVAFDYAMWRDWRALIAAVGNMPSGKPREQLLGALDRRLNPLFSKEQGLSFLGGVLRDRFQEGRTSQLSLYGPGEQLLALLPEGAYRTALADALPVWRHAAYGDKVPEMVEHGRGHVQRVQELLLQILHPLQHLESGAFFSHEEVFVLTTAAWLHDIGHSADYLTLEGLPSPWNNLPQVRYPVAGFPTLSRNFHHLLTAALINDPATRGAYGLCGWPADWLSAITAVCLYHRREMPLADDARPYEKGKQLGFTIPIPCPKTMTVNGSKVRTRLLATLYSICDGLDTQVERTASEAEEWVRQHVVAREVKGLLEQLATWYGASKLPTYLPLQCLVPRLLSARQDIISYCTNPQNGDIQRLLKALDGAVTAAIYRHLARYPTDSFEDPDQHLTRSALSLLDRLQFKTRQSAFHAHHRGLQAVYVLYLGHDGNKHNFQVRAVHSHKDETEAKRIVFGGPGKEGGFCAELKRPGVESVLSEACLSVKVALECIKDSN